MRMEFFLSLVSKIGDFLSVPMIILLIGGGLYLSFRLRFLQFRFFGHIYKMTFGKLSHKGDGEGSVSPFQAVASASASTVGAANIVGVPVAIALGGPGAIFWMWVAALIGMATKYTEAVLGLKYRVVNKEGSYIGGPMYYIENGLGWKWMAVVYSIFTALAILASASVQSNAVSGILTSSYNIPGYVTGIVIAILILIILVGGIKSIGAIASKMVPTMALIYISIALIVILVHITHIPQAFGLIFKYAFTPISATGGFAGAAIAAIIQMGIARGLYSNEAGVGSAAIAHASSTADHPSKQGFWGVMEVFFDTIIICTITALLILTTDVWKSIDAGAAATMPGAAIATVFGNGLANLIITVLIFFFAFTTILVIVYFAEKQVEYLFGYMASVYSRYVYASIIFVGSISSLVLIWSLLDILFALVVLPNMIALILLSKKVKGITDDYFTNHYKANK
jgi:AGCS family alanine or glycine:cation symporter